MYIIPLMVLEGKLYVNIVFIDTIVGLTTIREMRLFGVIILMLTALL